MPADLLLLRHGQTDWNLTHRIQGSVDIALNELGLAQARAVGDALKSRQLDSVVSSNLDRAIVTARLVNEPHGKPHAVDARLAERAHGRFEGWTVGEIIAEIGPDDIDAFFQHSPELESWDMVTQRVLASLGEVAATYPDGTALVVSHGGAIKAAVAAILGVHHRKMQGLFNCSLTHIRFEETWSVIDYNNVEHMPESLRS